MIQQLNQSVDPCEDFFQYACGGWIKNNPLKPGETDINGFNIVQKKNDIILKEAIESSWMKYSEVSLHDRAQLFKARLVLIQG